MSRKRGKRIRRRSKIWLYKEYVDLPRSIRNRTDPIVKRINKSKPGHKKSAQKGKEDAMKRLKKFAKRL